MRQISFCLYISAVKTVVPSSASLSFSLKMLRRQINAAHHVTKKLEFISSIMKTFKDSSYKQLWHIIIDNGFLFPVYNHP